MDASSQPPVAAPSSSPSALSYLDKALGALSKLGFAVKADQQAAIIPLLKDVSVVNEADALAIGRTLQHATYFNEVVRDQVASMDVGSRYEKITKGFDTIISDAKMMVTQLDDGKIDFKEKLQNISMKLTRGSIHSRFMKIRDVYVDVTKETLSQIEREKIILSAYLDFRGALLQAQVLAARMTQTQSMTLEAAKTKVSAATDAVAKAAEGEAKAQAQLARDEAIRAFQDEERRYDRLKKISENLTVSYSVGETVMARLSQTHSAKQTIYDQAVIFFTTNDSAFTSIDAALTSQAGLHESTKAVSAMTEGANRSLEALADIGTKVQEEALKVGHGATIKAESVKKLMDSVVDFQVRSAKLIEEARKEATQNAALMTKYVDEGKARYQQIIAPGSV